MKEKEEAEEEADEKEVTVEEELATSGGEGRPKSEVPREGTEKMIFPWDSDGLLVGLNGPKSKEEKDSSGKGWEKTGGKVKETLGGGAGGGNRGAEEEKTKTGGES